MKKIDWKRLLICLAIPLAVGGLAALLTGESMQAYSALVRPPLAPPAVLFPIVWTALYVLMGISPYFVCTAALPEPKRRRALTPYAVQLALNFVWPLLFFRLEAYFVSFLWLAALWLAVLAMVLAFRKVNRAAAWLQVPYLLWVTFAGYLNFSIWLLNP